MCVSTNQSSHFYYTHFFGNWMEQWRVFGGVKLPSALLAGLGHVVLLFLAMAALVPRLGCLQVSEWVGLELMVSIWAESLLAWTGTTPSPALNIVDQSVPTTHQRRLLSFRKFHASGPSPLFECPWTSPEELLSSLARRRNRYRSKETGKFGQEAIKWDAAWKNTDCYIWERK